MRFALVDAAMFGAGAKLPPCIEKHINFYEKAPVNWGHTSFSTLIEKITFSIPAPMHWVLRGKAVNNYFFVTCAHPPAPLLAPARSCIRDGTLARA